jgi:hypothetical protein
MYLKTNQYPCLPKSGSSLVHMRTVRGDGTYSDAIRFAPKVLYKCGTTASPTVAQSRVYLGQAVVATLENPNCATMVHVYLCFFTYLSETQSVILQIQ